MLIPSLKAINSKKSLLLILLLGVQTSLSGCDFDYWWSRGKPPAPSQLFTLSKSKLDQELASSVRSDIKEDFTKLEAMLVGANAHLSQGVGGDKLKLSLSEIQQGLAGLEGKLSFGSRPPYAELVGQLRGFEQIAKESGTVDKSVFKLYTARVYFFLANELSVLPPAQPLASYS